MRQNAWQRLQYSLLKVLAPLHPKFFVVGIRLPLYSYSCTVGKPTRNRLVYKVVANIDEMPYLGQNETKQGQLSVTYKGKTWQKEWQAEPSFAMMVCQMVKRRSVQMERLILVANHSAQHMSRSTAAWGRLRINGWHGVDRCGRQKKGYISHIMAYNPKWHVRKIMAKEMVKADHTDWQ